MSQVAIIGASGMLGTDLCTQLESDGYTLHPFNSKTLDICNDTIVSDTLSNIGPLDFVINCAAFTAVDECETQEDRAHAVNADGAKHIATYCQTNAIPFIHFSTDYVFDGNSTEPYLETDTPTPINVYGQSKWRGEQAIQNSGCNAYIFRVQAVFGKNGPHFMKAIQQLAQTKDSIDVVSDQFTSPTSTLSISKMISAVIKNSPPFGLYHFRNQGSCHWAEYAQFIMDETKHTTTIKTCDSTAFPRPAKRPKNAILNCDKFNQLACYTPPHWQDDVRTYLST
ncbi:dTDP-4-dehydrorhamnose reductase [Candidatus Marinamargulisbacteria bacterium SCGC AG-439-L15]|nr:dTDP-4-dehydrorhamnose reductase [Candidatus Marinamargulisbacteria bacterium SCGC AG-439-L15]